MIEEYKVVVVEGSHQDRRYISDIESQVKGYLAEGWTLYQGVSVSVQAGAITLAQAMVREGKKIGPNAAVRAALRRG